MLVFALLVHGKYVSPGRALRTWLPFVCVITCMIAIILLCVL